MRSKLCQTWRTRRRHRRGHHLRRLDRPEPALPIPASPGRGLIRSGEPAAAERYLQWTDAFTVSARSAGAVAAFRPITAYERGVAAQEVGDRAKALAQLEYFLREVDRPGPALESQVADAKARVARLRAQAR